MNKPGLHKHLLKISGSKNSGKTTLMSWLTGQLTARGYRVGVLKHSGHAHPVDKPGSDSDLARQAGAIVSAFMSEDGLGIFYPERDVGAHLNILEHIYRDCDVVLVESFRELTAPEIRVVREPETVVLKREIAVVSALELNLQIPVFKPGSSELIEFIEENIITD